jgi:hypothetical protein
MPGFWQRKYGILILLSYSSFIQKYEINFNYDMHLLNKRNMMKYDEIFRTAKKYVLINPLRFRNNTK